MQRIKSPNPIDLWLPKFVRLWFRLRFVLFQRHRYNQLVLEHVAGLPIVVLPGVFNPALFFSSEFFVGTFTNAHIPPAATVLELGTGSGIGAAMAARIARRVVAVDINPAAVRCARINMLLNQVEERVEVREGDLFEPVNGERFDVVLFNPPYFRGEAHSMRDRAFHSLSVAGRFAASLAEHLTPGGIALLVLSSIGDQEAFLQALKNQGFTISVIAERDLHSERLTVFKVALAR